MNAPSGFLHVSMGELQEDGAGKSWGQRSWSFICALVCTEILAVEMGKKGGCGSDSKEGNGRV